MTTDTSQSDQLYFANLTVLIRLPSHTLNQIVKTDKTHWKKKCQTHTEYIQHDCRFDLLFLTDRVQSKFSLIMDDIIFSQGSNYLPMDQFRRETGHLRFLEQVYAIAPIYK